MQNFTDLPNPRQHLICRLPRCNCLKCTKFTSKNKSDQNKNHLLGGIIDRDLNTSLDSTSNNPSLQSVLSDIVGVISFFITSSFMLWVIISRSIWHLTSRVLQSGRLCKLIALGLVLLLCLSITFHAIKGNPQRCRNIQSVTKPLVAQEQLENHAVKTPLSNNSLPQKEIPSLCDLCAKELKAETNNNMSSSKNPSLCELCERKLKAETNCRVLLNDEEAREMFKRYKLFSIASEMKFPPGFGTIIELLSIFYKFVF